MVGATSLVFVVGCVLLFKCWHYKYYCIFYDIYMIYLTAIGLTPGGSGTVNIYTQYTEYRDGTYIT
jgi:fucose permease